MFLNSISNSRENTFKQCKLKYYFYYVKRLLGIPTNEDALNFGSFIHKIFEEGWEATHIKELEKLAEQHRKTYKVPAQYNAKMKACLENFMKFNPKLGKTLYNEYHFKIDLGREIEFIGYIDRIVEGKNGKLLVIDYKTSKREKTKFDLFNDTQMKGYAYAVHKEFGVSLDDVMVAHYYPVTNNLVTIQYTKNQVYSYIKSLIDNAWKIRKAKKEDMKPKMNDFCNWCNYKQFCPLYVSDERLRQERLDEAKTRPVQKGRS